MPPPRRSISPAVERLDARIVLSVAPASTARPIPGEFPAADSHRPFSPADLQAYAVAYETRLGSPGFAPQFDFNGTGFIGQNDATPILRGLTGKTPRVPLRVDLALAPGQQVTGHHPANSGGVTRLGTITVVGTTTPNSIIFTDGPTTTTNLPLSNFKFQGIAVASDSRGHFEYTADLAAISRGGSLTTLTFLVRTPFGQQVIRAFPVRRLP